MGGLRVMKWLPDRKRLVVIVVLGAVALVVALMVAGPWALVVWGGGVAAAVGSDVIKNVVQRQVDDSLAPVSPLTVTARLDVGNYVRVPGDVGSRVVPRSGHAVDITIETGGPQAVILHGMEPVVDSREPLTGARPVVHRGMMPVRRFHVWLSEQPPRSPPTAEPVSLSR
jgi:hypothetical protein